jgi:hypothetical protein
MLVCNFLSLINTSQQDLTCVCLSLVVWSVVWNIRSFFFLVYRDLAKSDNSEENSLK